MDIDSEKIAALIMECAEKYILPRYLKLENHQINAKTRPDDLVTQADLDVEDHLRRILPDYLPGSFVIGEEGVSRGEISLDILNDETRSYWIVDPVDGTHNFVHGRPEFAVMIALVHQGVTKYGWIYDVLGKEMAIASLGEGAYLNGQAMKVAPLKALKDTSGFLIKSTFPKERREHVIAATASLKNTGTLRCAGHEYLNIAKGNADFAFFGRLRPWDHLAGSLLVQEAGGHAAKWDGTEYRPTDINEKLLVASGQEMWKNLLKLFVK